jgi:hypothetical protein
MSTPPRRTFVHARRAATRTAFVHTFRALGFWGITIGRFVVAEIMARIDPFA